jgi:broad specificity phosphatase PhoE
MRPLLAALVLLLAPLAAQAQPATVVLVRHGEKAPAPAGDPPLSAEGEARAEALARVLADAHVDAVITTELVRTRSTAAPLVRARGLTPIVVAAGRDVKAHAQATAAAVRARPAGEVVLVVGHSNTLPAIVAALGGPAMPELCDQEYATLMVLELRSDGPARLIRASFGAPDAPADVACHRGMRP